MSAMPQQQRTLFVLARMDDPPPPAPPPPRPVMPSASAVPAHWKYLSNQAERAIKALNPDGSWTKGHEIARRMGTSYDPKFWHMMRDLVDRNILESCQGHGRGYRLRLA